MFIECMVIVLASRIRVLVGKTVGKITNHCNVRGALGNLYHVLWEHEGKRNVTCRGARGSKWKYKVQVTANLR